MKRKIDEHPDVSSLACAIARDPNIQKATAKTAATVRTAINGASPSGVLHRRRIGLAMIRRITATSTDANTSMRMPFSSHSSNASPTTAIVMSSRSM